MEREEPIDLVKKVYELHDDNKRLQGVNKALLEAAKDAKSLLNGFSVNPLSGFPTGIGLLIEKLSDAIREAEKEAGG